MSIALTGLAVTAAFGQQVRIAAWNISNYSGGRTADIQTSTYGSFQGRSFSPDAIIGQEILNSSAAAAFVSALNTAAGSPGDWASWFAPLGSTNDVALFYRTTLFDKVGTAPVLIDAGAPGPTTAPRDTYRFDVKIKNNSDTAEVLAMYGVHMKAGDTAEDKDRRQASTTAIRNNANGLGSNYRFLLGSDTNTQSSNEAPYQTLISAGGSGRFFDPIKSPGTWNNSAGFRFLHTQDPTGSGGMDDRHDQLLLGGSLIDGIGTDYVGNANLAYSTSTWDDPNHSYRSWGNDGTSLNTQLTVTGNQMVGPSIAQALKNTATTAGGHLPVFLDLRYQAVPEPATFAVVGLGLGILVRRRKRA